MKFQKIITQKLIKVSKFCHIILFKILCFTLIQSFKKIYKKMRNFYRFENYVNKIQDGRRNHGNRQKSQNLKIFSETEFNTVLICNISAQNVNK